MTEVPAKLTVVEGENTLLETIPEIIAKKIHYRGSQIKPRDIFDIAAAGEQYADLVINALRSLRPEVSRTLARIETLDREFIGSAIAGLAIKEPFRPLARTALQRTTEILRAV